MGKGHRLLGDYRGSSDMRVGTLVKIVYRSDWVKIGVITSIGSPNPIAKVLWADGKTSVVHTKWLGVVCK